MIPRSNTYYIRIFEGDEHHPPGVVLTHYIRSGHDSAGMPWYSYESCFISDNGAETAREDCCLLAVENEEDLGTRISRELYLELIG